MPFAITTIKRLAIIYKQAIILTLSFLLLLTNNAYALNHQLKGNTLTIHNGNTQISITARTEAAMEVFYQQKGIKQLPSFALDEKFNQAKQPKVKLTETPTHLKFSTNKLTAVIKKSPLQIAYYKDNQLLLSEESGYFAHDTMRGFRFKLSDSEKLLGTGERVLGMNRRGHKLPLYNKASYGYTTQAEQMYYSLPAIMSTNKYILLFDNSAKGDIDLGKSESDILQFEAVGGRTSYFVFTGSTYPNLIKNYVEVTGKQPLPPRWAFGNYASRFGYHTQKEVEETVKKFKQQDFPLDAIVLDLYWFGPDIKGHMGNLDWDKKAFPEPEKMLKNLKNEGINTILITEPFVLTSSQKWQDAVDNKALATNFAEQPKRFDFYFGNTGLIDVFNPVSQQWFNQTYQKLHDQGVTGWWGDLGEPEVHPSDTVHTLADGTKATADEIHNAYGHQWAKMLNKKQLEMAPKQRPFIMMRSGFAGSQRYGMIPWTGDVSRSWDGLKPQVELSLQMGLLGLGYTHSDLGGFAGGEKFDPEMYTRWLQYGVFQPVYRPHGQEHIASEPVFHDQKTQDIVRKFVKLRYRLLPYIYTLAYQNSTTGMPLMRPLFFEDETNLNLIDNSHEYLWGDAFLVSPIVDPNITSQKVMLPNGVWFNYWNSKKYQGNQSIDFPVNLETIPVLVRAGSFIPMVNDISSTKDYSSRNLTINYYADASVKTATGMMYDDDGKTNQSIEKGLYELLNFSANQQDNKLTITLEKSGKGYTNIPKARDINMVIHHWKKQPSIIMLAQNKIKLVKNESVFNNSTIAAFWDKKSQKLLVKFNWKNEKETLAITN